MISDHMLQIKFLRTFCDIVPCEMLISVNAREHIWLSVNIVAGNCVLPLGNMVSPGPVLSHSGAMN